jgi:hypothetical protein
MCALRGIHPHVFLSLEHGSRTEQLSIRKVQWLLNLFPYPFFHVAFYSTPFHVFLLPVYNYINGREDINTFGMQPMRPPLRKLRDEFYALSAILATGLALLTVAFITYAIIYGIRTDDQGDDLDTLERRIAMIEETIAEGGDGVGGIPSGIMPAAINRVQYHIRQSGYLVILEGVDSAATNNVGGFNGAGTGNKAILTIEMDTNDTAIVGVQLNDITTIRCSARGILRDTGTDFDTDDFLYLNVIINTTLGPRILVASKFLGATDLPLTTTFKNITFDTTTAKWGIVGGPEFGLNDNNAGPGLALDTAFTEYGTATLSVISDDGGFPSGTPVGPIVFAVGSSNTLEPRRMEFEWVEYQTSVDTFRYNFI